MTSHVEQQPSRSVGYPWILLFDWRALGWVSSFTQAKKHENMIPNEIMSILVFSRSKLAGDEPMSSERFEYNAELCGQLN